MTDKSSWTASKTGPSTSVKQCERLVMRQDLRLLPVDLLLKTGPVDQAAWNYRFILGWLQRRRFRMALSLFPNVPIARILEVGYGSGVLMPELARRCKEIYGIDPHPHPKEVMENLGKVGVNGNLQSGTAEQLPYEDNFFDVVMAVSSLEFIEDLPRACKEMKRVLKPGGSLIAVTPGDSPLLDAGLRLVTGQKARDSFGDRRALVIPTLKAHFSEAKRLMFPPILNPLLKVYTAMSLVPKVSGVAGHE